MKIPKTDFAWRIVLAGLVLSGTGLVLLPIFARSVPAQLCHRAAGLLSGDQPRAALAIAEQVLKTHPEHPQALLIAGECCSLLSQPENALAYFQKTPIEATIASIHSLYRQGEKSLALGRLREAERALLLALKSDPDHYGAHLKLAWLYQLQSRNWEAVPHLLPAIQQGNFTANELLIIGGGHRIFVEDHIVLDSARKSDPEDFSSDLSEARRHFRDNRTAEAEDLLRKILKAHPDLLEAQAILGQILVRQSDPAEFHAWRKQLPQNADAHPEVWFARGIWAGENNQPRAAIRCFLETLRRHPNHLESNYQLSQLFLHQKEPELSEQFARRADGLTRLDYIFSDLASDLDAGRIREVVEALLELKRSWEAIAWAEIVLRRDPETQWARDVFDQLRPIVRNDGQFTPKVFNPAWRIDLDQYPLPDFDRPASSPYDRPEYQADRVRFDNQAQVAGIDFTYFNSMDPELGLTHLLQTTGGGVAVMDYDADGWPDLYFPNGCPLVESLEAINIESGEHRDRLYRNLGHARFEDVTDEAILGDGRYSQGATSGDFNQDGFPDLYVCNLGGNRFYMNNGDGTFSEVTDATQTAGNEWSLSAAFADLNRDAFPDLYVVNYLKKEDVYRRCDFHAGRLTCAPTQLDAEQDRLYLNLGDGRFQDVTETSGIKRPDGKGQGIVAADFDGSGRLNLFISNDTTQNFYFINKTIEKGGPILLEDQALLTGLAVNGDGVTQASMGIAAGDGDGDGRIDLFVTNFYEDSNTYYQLQPTGLFSDQTRQKNLRDSGFNLLGFGTQFLDAERDGDLDLVIANGHVDQTSSTGDPDKMPAQYLPNLGNGHFGEDRSAERGEYFREKHFGRGLARLDWNRDGLEDFCVTHLEAPIALLTNTTPEPGNFLCLRLVGKQCDRDAIGTVAVLNADGRVLTRQLTAGDGYETCNEKLLSFGLGDFVGEVSLTLQWPSGTQDVFPRVPINQFLLAVEGEPLKRLDREN